MVNKYILNGDILLDTGIELEQYSKNENQSDDVQHQSSKVLEDAVNKEGVHYQKLEDGTYLEFEKYTDRMGEKKEFISYEKKRDGTERKYDLYSAYGVTLDSTIKRYEKLPNGDERTWNKDGSKNEEKFSDGLRIEYPTFRFFEGPTEYHPEGFSITHSGSVSRENGDKGWTAKLPSGKTANLSRDEKGVQKYTVSEFVKTESGGLQEVTTDKTKEYMKTLENYNRAKEHTAKLRKILAPRIETEKAMEEKTGERVTLPKMSNMQKIALMAKSKIQGK